MPVTSDKPWRRPGAAAYARARLRGFLRPPVTVTAAPSELVEDLDVAIPMRDGVLLRVNVYRPSGAGPFPVLVCAHPYGKDKLPRLGRRGWKLNPQYRIMNQTEPLTISSKTSWEAPDPAWWTDHGYAVINADTRGAGTSGGVGSLFSDQEAEDIADLIEWAGTQTWSNGNVGMLGVSYLAISQYKAAALHPPHLKAICPWEGFTDAYRDLMTPGGVEEQGFSRIWQTTARRTVRLTDNFGKSRKQHPLRDEWWQSLTPNLADITVPMLVCASFSDHNVHSQGSFRAFMKSGSTDRHLYTHRGGKWAVFYGDEARRTQLRFFDRHLRGDTVAVIPRVRLEVRERADSVAEVRDENEWPLARTEWRDLFFRGDGSLGEHLEGAGTARFDLRRNAASFTMVFTDDCELTGPMSLRLWASLDGPSDANLFVGVEKWTGKTYVPFEGSYGYRRDRISDGRLRLALREVDGPASAPGQPEYRFLTPKPVAPGEIVPLEIGLGASSTIFRAGDTLRLLIAGRYLEPANPLWGHFPARYAASKSGHCTLHWDADRPSALTVPVIPRV